MKNIFEYDNYREYLKDFYSRSKLRDKKFSFRYFSKLGGFQSPTVLKHVMESRSNLSDRGIDKFSKALKLNTQESLFFRHLVYLNQAKSLDERDFHSQQIRKLKEYRKIQPLKEAQYNYFSKWYFIAVKELVDLPQFREDPGWIAKSIFPNISKKQAEEALEQLKILELIMYNENGKLVSTAANIATPDEVLAPSVAVYHRESMRLALDSIESVPRDERDVSTVTLGLSKESIAEAKKIISQFRRDILELSTHHQPCDRVYQVNIQFFPTAKVEKE